jgi:hypothetical protein
VASPGVEAAEDGSPGSVVEVIADGLGSAEVEQPPDRSGEQEHEPAALAVNARSGGGGGETGGGAATRPASPLRNVGRLDSWVKLKFGRGLTLPITDGLGVVGLVAGHLWSYRWCQPPRWVHGPSPGQWSGRTEHETPDLILGVSCLAQLVEHRGDPSSEPVQPFEEQVQAAGQDDQQHH